MICLATLSLHLVAIKLFPASAHLHINAASVTRVGSFTQQVMLARISTESLSSLFSVDESFKASTVLSPYQTFIETSPIKRSFLKMWTELFRSFVDFLFGSDPAAYIALEDVNHPLAQVGADGEPPARRQRLIIRTSIVRLTLELL